MATIQEIHKKLNEQCPIDYQINEIIRFAYPFRQVKIKATVNKSPEKSIQQIYTTFLKTIRVGFSKEADFIQFLGLHDEDFILKELYFLREKGFADIIDNHWTVTEQGELYIKDNSILQILEQEDFWFLIDGLTGEVLPFFKPSHDTKTDKELKSVINYNIKSPELLKGKNEQLADAYKAQNNNQAYLIDYDKENIPFDKKDFHDYYLIEYIPIKAKQDTVEPYIEIRNIDEDYSLDKHLSEVLLGKYEELIMDFSDSERTSFSKIKEDEPLINTFEQLKRIVPKNEKAIEELSIWETQAKLEEALRTVKKRILIESPWIKRATLQYIFLMEEALKRDVEIFILYGIESNDEHHRKAEGEVQRLYLKYEKFHLTHLPTHFEDLGNTKMTGTHRKLLIKDDEYYINGSFNFLYFNRKEGQTIANEESTLIRNNVENKWKRVFKEYQINLKMV
jgi:hypothetical protein